MGLSANPLLARDAPRPETQKRKFYTVLSLGRIGFETSFQQTVDLALKNGFEGVDPDPEYFATLSDSALRRLRDDVKAKGLRLGNAGLPVEFRRDEQTFNDGLKKLPEAAKNLERAGVTRVGTWILPFDESLTYLQNFRQHAARLKDCARVLDDHGQKLGLEYVAPRTSWRSARHPFIHTLSETRELAVAIGAPNVGFQLDAYHWFNAEETGADILTLRAEDIITVDLNDAPAGLTLDQQKDLARELPAATGLIPVKDFLGALIKIGYEGPIQAEPFNKALRTMSVEQACAATIAAIRKAFSVASVA